MKKSSKSSPKKRSPDISLQYKNQASYKFSKKKLLHLAKKRAGGGRVKSAFAFTAMQSPSEGDLYASLITDLSQKDMVSHSFLYIQR